jgi:hypothetical protein
VSPMPTRTRSGSGTHHATASQTLPTPPPAPAPPTAVSATVEYALWAGAPGGTGPNRTLPPSLPAPVAVGASLRNILALRSACAGTFHFLPLVPLVGALLLLARCLHAMYVRRRDGDVALAVRTLDTTWQQALPHWHAYVGLAWPCTPHCGTVHTARFLCHFLCMCLVASTVLVKQPALLESVEARHPRSIVFSAVLTVVVGAALWPVLGALYGLYRVVDTRAEHTRPPCTAEPAQDLLAFGARRHPAVGGTSSSLRRLRRVVARARADADPVATPPAAIARTTGKTAAVKLKSSERPNDDEVAARLKASGHSADVPADLRTTVTVTAHPFRPAAHAVAGLASLVCFLVTWWNTLPWCPPQLRAFGIVLGAAMAFDAVVMQPACVVLGVVWAWLVDDGDDDDGDVEETDESPTATASATKPTPNDVPLTGGNARERQQTAPPPRRHAWLPRLDRHVIDGQPVFVGAFEWAMDVDVPPPPVVPTAVLDVETLRGPRNRARRPKPIAGADIDDDDARTSGAPHGTADSVPAFGTTDDKSAFSLTQLEGTGGMSGTHDTAFSLTQLEGTGGLTGTHDAAFSLTQLEATGASQHPIGRSAVEPSDGGSVGIADEDL